MINWIFLDYYLTCLNLLPRFNSEKKEIIEEHINVFQDFIENSMLKDEDVFMNLFMKTP